MGFFGNLFKKEPAEPKIVSPAKISERSKGISIDIRDDCVMIDGKRFDIPFDIDAIKAVWGKPRFTELETPESMRVYLEESSGMPVTNRSNYTFDELGVEYFTYDGKTVFNFSVYLNTSKLNYKAVPQMMFGGSLTINGQPWLPIIKRGKETCAGTSQKIIVGKHSVIADLIDCNLRASKRTEANYSRFSISIDDDYKASDSAVDALALEMLQKSLEEKAKEKAKSE